MKKIILFAVIAVIALLSSTPTFAQKGYRGFVDAELGGEIYIDYGGGFSGGISTVHGYQSGSSFFGIGVGCIGSINSHIDKKFNVPFFIQYRYDHSLASNYSFFGKARAGYTALGNNVFVGLGSGIRIALHNGNNAVNLGINLTYTNPTDYKLSRRHSSLTAALSIGFEF